MCIASGESAQKEHEGISSVFDNLEKEVVCSYPPMQKFKLKYS